MAKLDDLPDDLLYIIFSKLIGWRSFSLVCRHWKTIAESSPPRRYSPSLINYCSRSRTWKFYQHDSFSFNKSFLELENACIHCSNHGWLLMSWCRTLFFLDPISNREIELPWMGERCTSFWFFNPPTSPKCVVVGIGTGKICKVKRGENEWKIWRHSKANDFCFWGSVGGPVLYRGLIYFLGWDGEGLTLDIQKNRLDFDSFKFRQVRRIIKECYLVKADEDGVLYAVLVDGLELERRVWVYRRLKKRWHLVKSIGDKVFYLSHMSSFGCKAPTKSMENAICFPMFRGDVPVFYSLNDAKYHSLDGDYSADNPYGLKWIDLAGWIMPMQMPVPMPMPMP